MYWKTILKSSLLLVACTLSGTLSAQVFTKVGNGISINHASIYGTCSYADNGEVYFGYLGNDFNPYSRHGYVAKWDGLQWVQYPELPQSEVSAIAMYQGDLYAAAHNYGTGNVYRFDGNSWQPIFSTLSGYVVDLEVHNNQLICAGNFSESTTGNYSIVGYDGNAPVAFPTLEVNDSVRDINVINNEIWAAGDFENNSSFGDTVHLKKLTAGTNWEYPAIAHKPAVGGYNYSHGIFEYNGNIYLLGYYSISKIANDTAYLISQNYAYDYAEFNGQMYLTGNTMKIFDGNSASTIGNAPSAVQAVVSNGSDIFGFFGDTIYNGDKSFHHVFRGNSQFGILSGRSYIDNNANCTYDAATDQVVGRMKFQAQGNPSATITTNYRSGTYNVALAPGTYAFSNITNLSAMNRYLVPTCNNATGITIQANQSYTEDMVIKHDGTIDVESRFRPYLWHRARQGFTEGYTVKLRNPGAAISGNIDMTVTLPPTVSLVSSVPQASSSSGNTYTFSFNGIGEREEKKVDMLVKINLSTNSIGDTIWFYSAVTGVAADADLSNNMDTIYSYIVGACDPNDKTPSVSESLPGLRELDYHVRFQNTGTDTAYNVVVVDTLESYFDPASIVINDASHDYGFDIVDGNILVWTFNNILLPDSGANQMGSRGYVNFSIDVDPNLQIGDEIDNDVEIYFDYQPAVHTNHAITAIVQWVSIEEEEARQSLAEVYPNPAGDFVNVRNTSGRELELAVFSVSGRKVAGYKVARDLTECIDLSQFPAGVYLFKIGQETLKVLVK